MRWEEAEKGELQWDVLVDGKSRAAAPSSLPTYIITTRHNIMGKQSSILMTIVPIKTATFPALTSYPTRHIQNRWLSSPLKRSSTKFRVAVGYGIGSNR